MPECKNLIHPFQTDPGTSQASRLIPDLVTDAPKIDGRTLSDLLDYFTKLSRHVNFYDNKMGVSDWQLFFNTSVPFILASISKFNSETVKEKFDLYTSLFNKRPGKNSLQLLVYYIYYTTIFRINSWHLAVRDSGLAFESILVNLVKDQLQEPVQTFIHLANAAAREHCIRSIDFSTLLQNDIWNLKDSDLLLVDHTARARRGRRNRMVGLMQELASLWPTFTEAIARLGDFANDSIEGSLFQQKEELKQQHAPHLALLFAFLKLFQHLQLDLNTFTKKHLDFFFKDVLRLASRPATPDKAHIVFEIQKQLKSYLVKKDVVVRDAKDKSNAEILFSLDEEIVVNQAKVDDVKTLFLHNEPAHDDINFQLLEGVYMAPHATKADGDTKDFAEADPKNWPTLGAQFSKFIDVGKTSPQPYPYARIGFILASPVLLLNEGHRTVNIQFLCKDNANCLAVGTQPIIKDATLFALLATAMTETYIIVTKDLIAQAEKKGVDIATVTELKALLPEIVRDPCCPVIETLREDRVQLIKSVWESSFLNNIIANRPNEVEILKEAFPEHRVFKINFSGKDDWIVPSAIETISIVPSGINYLVTIKANLEPEKPAVTFFDKKKLKEDLETKLPVAKIEIDNEIKIIYDPGNPTVDCCFENCPSNKKQSISLYQFFRNLSIIKGADETKIEVSVCGVKNLFVRNDENVLDVNSPMAAFGVRPKITSSFYVGSKEIFSKNWQEVFLNVEWKDRPVDFAVHYENYFYEVFEDGSNQITNDSFKIRASLRAKGGWLVNAQKTLFEDPSEPRAPFCNHPAPLWNQNVYHYLRTDFPGNIYQPVPVDVSDLPPLNVNSVYGFLRIMLEGVGFQHDRYAFVLARHMMALADLVDPVSLNAAIIHLTTVEDLADEIHNRVDDIIPSIASIQGNINSILDKLTHDEIGPLNPLLDGVFLLIAELDAEVNNAIAALGIPDVPTALTHLGNASTYAGQIIARIGSTGTPNTIIGDSETIQVDITAIDFSINNNPDADLHTADLGVGGIHELIVTMQDRIDDIKGLLKVNQALKNGLPKEAYTPLIKDFSVDYNALAFINDIDLIHLYPYENTHKDEEIELLPALFPSHCDEGTLYIGLKQLIPGSNVNILFQLAEATADSESDPAEILWHYLSSNQWKPLRSGFEVLKDDTNNLTTSGIIKLFIPGNITNDNTVLPRNLHWIKAAAAENVIAVSETIGIHTQAMQATFNIAPANDQLRLDAPLEAKKLSKLQVPDANIKKVEQPYETFGGRVPEAEGYYYIRVSEWLRHKGRGIQKFDYERLVLDAFPQVFKVKCINHEFGLNAHLYRLDVNAAPGYVVIAVIPDLKKLKSGQSFEPKVPLSLLEKITEFLRKRTSPFARIRVMNPRYEKIDICITVQLIKGKDKVYYKNQLEYELRLFLAPWAIGENDKLSFGQCVNRSDIVRFIEGRDYVDYIICLRLSFEEECGAGMTSNINEICPLTPRSILIGGNIDVCIPAQDDCEDWKNVPDECSKSFDITTVECAPEQPPIG